MGCGSVAIVVRWSMMLSWQCKCMGPGVSTEGAAASRRRCSLAWEGGMVAIGGPQGGTRMLRNVQREQSAGNIG